ncbi:hypothetical protein BDP27DRAFT_1401053 [Rhodocollybia butyracea]|uniref:Uncharacterized protein n=1 Tax=Rhodocollybia butyracea TaxID=206335 RepID=A0A9P5PZG2_9AGAR|nr:hypothetical protein BDP27DRAFT_1401053 [Rhodocollybia butyracea]
MATAAPAPHMDNTANSNPHFPSLHYNILPRIDRCSSLHTLSITSHTVNPIVLPDAAGADTTSIYPGMRGWNGRICGDVEASLKRTVRWVCNENCKPHARPGPSFHATLGGIVSTPVKCMGAACTVLGTVDKAVEGKGTGMEDEERHIFFVEDADRREKPEKSSDSSEKNRDKTTAWKREVAKNVLSPIPIQSAQEAGAKEKVFRVEKTHGRIQEQDRFGNKNRKLNEVLSRSAKGSTLQATSPESAASTAPLTILLISPRFSPDAEERAIMMTLKDSALRIPKERVIPLAPGFILKYSRAVGGGGPPVVRPAQPAGSVVMYKYQNLADSGELSSPHRYQTCSESLLKMERTGLGWVAIKSTKARMSRGAHWAKYCASLKTE